MSSSVSRVRLMSRESTRVLLMFCGVVVIAALIRARGITTWSMWEDEQGTVSRLQEPFVRFQGFFPLFFLVLKGWLAITGFSVGAARLVPAAFGVISIAITFLCFRRLVSNKAALLAAMFVAVNVGHLFFSQSIRYYTTLVVFELLAVHFFLDGFERGRILSLLLANVAFVLAMLTHFSALLLAPVWVGYLFLMAVMGEKEAGYTYRNYCVFGAVLLGVLVIFSWRIAQLRSMLGNGEPTISSARDPVHIGITVVAYFGLPVLGLAILAPWLARQLPRRIVIFLLTASFIPILELLVIARLNVINVTWYYAFIALFGCALLGGAVLTGLWERGWRRTATSVGTASLLYYGAFLAGYYTIWYGDRPRWEEAVVYLRQAADIKAGPARNLKIFASVPSVVELYLCTDPLKPEVYPAVNPLPPHPEALNRDQGCWYVVEAKVISPEYRTWFAEHCELAARFEARTGPIDRSVLVYRQKEVKLPEENSLSHAASPL